MKKFSESIEEFVKLSKKRFERTMELFIVDFTDTLFRRTPIGNPALWKFPAPPNYVPGTLINSWHTGFSPAVSTRMPDKSASVAKAEAAMVAKQAAGNIVYITNPAPYAFRIEYDAWSTQAPTGMLRITAAENIQRLSKAVKNAK